MAQESSHGYVPLGQMDLYWESRGGGGGGGGGTPLIAVHGGYGLASTLGPLLDELAAARRVIAVELQGHGHTCDVDRPFSFEGFGDDLAGVIEQLGLDRADLLGYSLGGQASLRCAIQHPDLVRRLALVSVPCRRDAWFPEVRAGFDRMSAAGFDQMRHSPVYEAWRRVAPDPDAFPTLMDKTGALLRQPYDWSEEVRGMRIPTLLAYADADGVPPIHAAEFFGLLGGGQRDAGWEGSLPSEMRLAILPGRTHYDVMASPWLAEVVADFLA